MYLEWAKKQLVVVLSIQISLMIITMIVNGFQFLYIYVFFSSIVLFGLMLLIIYKFTANMTSSRTVINVLLLDIGMIVIFVLSLFYFYEGLLSVLFWGLVPLRNFTVLYCKKFNIRGL